MKKITLYLIVVIVALATVFTACKKDTTAVTGVTLNENTLTLTVGQEEILVATVLPDDATNKSVTWSSDNPAVATVLHGVVTARGVGDAIITVTTVDGEKTDVCTVFVQAAPVLVTDITLNHAVYSLETGDILTLQATVFPATASNKSVTWSSSDPNLARVDSNGRITAAAVGIVVITATTVDGNKQARCTLDIRSVPSRATDCRPVPSGPGFEPLADIGTVTFFSNQTWIVGNQEWSDMVKASNCSDRTSYIGINDAGTVSYINCRSNPGYGDLFSWCAVFTYRRRLCPDGWRLPTVQDFVELDLALGGDGETRPRPGVENDASIILYRYVNEWGAVYAGSANGTGLLGGQLDNVWYWQQTELAAHSAGYTGLIKAGQWTNGFVSEGSVSIQGASTTAMGATVRCVRQAAR